MTAWTAVTPPPDAPAPEAVPGCTYEPILWPNGTLRGYKCVPDDGGDSDTVAWAHNGDPGVQSWQVMPLPTKQGKGKPAPEPAPPPTESPAASTEQNDPSESKGSREAAGDTPYPFTLLGHDHGSYYYMGHGTQQLTVLKASQHTGANLYQLAPLSFWSRRWSAKRGFDSDQAAADLMTAQHAIGVYSTKRIRGRGAWWDEDLGYAVVHLGDRLLINGRECDLNAHGTRYIYESAESLPVREPLRKGEAVKLKEILERISWEKPVSARLAAGWIVCAMICGALRWKPNIWLLGPKESGKSTVIEKIIFKALGENCLYALGGTTEASLRAMLRADAMPVIIDDMDSSTARGRENNQAIFGLMRIFSGEGGGGLHKASQTGGAVNSYKIHSCYIYSGITLEADKSADISRIAPLKLSPRKFQKNQYEDLLTAIANTLTPEFSQSLFARCIKLIPTIRKNAETFAQAIAAQTGSRRSGDVNGHLFAGVYSLHSDGLISEAEATDYVGSRAEVMALIHEEKQSVAENNEGDKCLYHLIEQTVTDTLDGKMWRGSIYDLLKLSRGNAIGAAAHADYLLRRTGLICKGEFFYVANDHTVLRELYKNSPWPTGWAGVLKTIAGAESEPMMSFGGRKARATRLPLSLLSDERPAPPAPLPDNEPQDGDIPM